jgi:hypothetical protein
VTEEHSLINVVSVSDWSAKSGFCVGTHFEPMRTRTRGKHCRRNITWTPSAGYVASLLSK